MSLKLQEDWTMQYVRERGSASRLDSQYIEKFAEAFGGKPEKAMKALERLYEVGKLMREQKTLERGASGANWMWVYYALPPA